MVVLAALVADRVGTLSRMTGLCGRRGYNVLSVTVSPTSEEDVKRLTLALDCQEDPESLRRQFLALADVLEVRVLTAAQRVDRELLLAKVRLGPDGSLPPALASLSARVIWQEQGVAIVEATGPAGALEDLASRRILPEVLEAVLTGHTCLETGPGRMEIPPPHDGSGPAPTGRGRRLVRLASVPPLTLPEPRPDTKSGPEEALAR
jgi:acetolactate synthase-1/3 small subunit